MVAVVGHEERPRRIRLTRHEVRGVHLEHERAIHADAEVAQHVLEAGGPQISAIDLRVGREQQVASASDVVAHERRFFARERRERAHDEERVAGVGDLLDAARLERLHLEVLATHLVPERREVAVAAALERPLAVALRETDARASSHGDLEDAARDRLLGPHVDARALAVLRHAEVDRDEVVARDGPASITGREQDGRIGPERAVGEHRLAEAVARRERLVLGALSHRVDEVHDDVARLGAVAVEELADVRVAGLSVRQKEVHVDVAAELAQHFLGTLAERVPVLARPVPPRVVAEREVVAHEHDAADEQDAQHRVEPRLTALRRERVVRGGTRLAARLGRACLGGLAHASTLLTSSTCTARNTPRAASERS
jgi:hypothetical protein